MAQRPPLLALNPPYFFFFVVFLFGHLTWPCTLLIFCFVRFVVLFFAFLSFALNRKTLFSPKKVHFCLFFCVNRSIIVFALHLVFSCCFFDFCCFGVCNFWNIGYQSKNISQTFGNSENPNTEKCRKNEHFDKSS